MSEMYKKKNTRKTGDIGERVAEMYLKNHEFTILETNYLKNWGELDIVAQKGEVIHFVEVKTYKFASKEELERTMDGETWQPEELVDSRKLHQIKKALETWLPEKRWEREYQIDVVAVKIVPDEQYATVKYFENVNRD